MQVGNMVIPRLCWKLLAALLLSISVVTFLYYGSGAANTYPSKLRKLYALNEHDLSGSAQADTAGFSELKHDTDGGIRRKRQYRRVVSPPGGTHAPAFLTKPCARLVKPAIEATDMNFQLMPERQMYVYSAFLDLRTRPYRTIRIHGFSPRAPLPFYCQLYYPDGAVYSARGMADDLSWDDRAERRASFHFKSQMYLCDEPVGKVPISVGLTPGPCLSNITNLVTVHVRKKINETQIRSSLLVCLKTLYSLRSPYRIIEFLEYQKLFGATNVVIYDYDHLSPVVTNVLHYYSKQGFVKIIPWQIPLKTNRKAIEGVEIRTYGQRTQINDCLYRFMNNYKYILNIDIDEFVVPVQESISNYSQLIEQVLNNPKIQSNIKGKKTRQAEKQKNTYKIGKRGAPHLSSILLPHVDFCLGPLAVVSEKAESLLLQIHMRSEPPTGNHDRRVKSIINPRRVIATDEHKVRETLRHFRKSIKVSPDVALLHHYRQHHPLQCTTQDRSANRYKAQLIKSINYVCSQLKIDHLPP